jgi:hypothetical protein
VRLDVTLGVASPAGIRAHERPFAVVWFTVIDDCVAVIDVSNDPELVAALDIRGITA